MEFFTNIDIHFYIAIILSVANGVLLCFVGYKFLQIIQLSNYKISGYNEWLKDTKGKYISRILFLCFLSTIGVLVTNAVFDAYTNTYLSYVGLIFYIYFSFVFIKKLYSSPKKTPLKNTHRINRLTVCLFFLNTILTFGLIALSTEYLTLFRFGVIALTPLALILLVPLAHFIMFPLERLIGLSYINKSKKILSNMPNLIKIGITGSYGKTSCKYILNTMLGTKYSVCMSPSSFNTPMGLTKVVTKYLEPHHEILIAEMGANQIGDIRYLCSIIEPNYAILTGIGNQHLRLFRSQQNITKTKSELAEYIESVKGTMVFNGNNPESINIFNKTNCKKFLISIDDESSFVHIRNPKFSIQGMEFELVVNKETISVRTKLLGEHNLLNIALCTALATKLGVTLEKIKEAITRLEPIPHRLELVNKGEYTILDDSFNSNIEGCHNALKTLSLFENQKIVVTPGLIELGELENDANLTFAKEIAQLADDCIIVNRANREALRTGLLEGGMDASHIYEFATFNEAFDLVKSIATKNSCVLIENDLPDNYT